MRKETREALVTVFAEADEFNQVLGHAPINILGMDKVLAIYSRRTQHVQESAHLAHNFYVFALDVYVKREGGVAAEDTLDDLHEVIRETVKANQSNPNWDWLHLEEASAAYFAEISGVSYRVESHPLFVKVTD